MAENDFRPRIVVLVCKWCTYAGADLAGTSRIQYPENLRIIRFPCTGRIDAEFIIKAFENGADAVWVSGCHPGDCHYNAGNYYARRRWAIFLAELEFLGIDPERIKFTWISAAQGRKFAEDAAEYVEQVRKLGPYESFRALNPLAQEAE